MNHFLLTCLKILAGLAIGLLIIHVWPFAIVPAFAFVVLAGLFAGFLFLATLTAGAVGVGVLGALLAVAAAVLAVLSPIWIPVVFILGIVWIIKRLGSAGRRPSAA